MSATTGPVRRIGRYTIEQVIGTGAFATVYRATDERLDATVAIKLLADNHCLDPDIRARFVDEGRALRRVDSPHVLRVYDIGETEQMQPYLVVEHADRGTLAQRVAQLRETGWRPGVDDLRLLVADLAAAVEAVHAAHLVHRDLSPGNVLLRSAPAADPADSGRRATALVTPGERLVVADLGLAKDLARSSGLTVAGGTEGFRPPEQRGRPGRVDGRADLWALSAVLFWLVTGQAPGTDDDVGDPGGIDGRLERSLAELALPAGVGAPLLTGLADDPAQRHPDVQAWRTAVESGLVLPAATAAAPHAGSVPQPGLAPQAGAVSPAGPVPQGGSLSHAGSVPQGGSLPAAVSGLQAGLMPEAGSVPATGSTAGGRARWPRALAVVALVLVGAAAGAALAVWWSSSSDDGGTTTRRLGDGRVAVSDTAGDARLSIVGPDEATVGDTVTFEAQAEGVDQWAWLMPDGTVYADALTAQIRPRSAGTAEVTLVGVAESGERLEVVHRLRLADG